MSIGPSALAAYNLAWGPLCDLSLSASAAEPIPLAELLSLADEEATRLWERLG